MFNELNVQLNIDTAALPKGSFFLINESDVDGSFLIHHFLSAYLKGGSTVCFLGLAQSYSHYSAVAHRLGLDLNAAKDSGQLHFIDGLNFSLELMHDGNEGTQQNPLLTTRIKDGNTKDLYCLVKEKLSSVTSHGGTLLLIDDLSLLASLGVKPQQIDQFVQYCLASLPSNTLVTLIHNDPRLDDEELSTLATHLRHRADTLLLVEGLSSGYCKDVHGQLTILHQTSGDTAGCRRQAKALHYKVLDKTVNLFPIGTSVAVL
ncbi:elongator complex protein 6-like [Amphiura filiformis]|uniref:elongator complex protein 6-like n=1 Tax=Amphiura filiformis TaxID=82378 RepID=UPI003B21ED48